MRLVCLLFIMLFLTGKCIALSVSLLYIGGGNFDFISSLAVSKEGSVYVAGYTFKKGNYDAFVAKISPDFKKIERFLTFGGKGNDYAYGLAFSRDGGVIVVGSTQSEDLHARLIRTLVEEMPSLPR